MPPRHARTNAGDTDTIERETHRPSQECPYGMSHQLRDVIAARLPDDMPEADREAVLAMAVRIAAPALLGLIEVAIDIGLGDPARSKGCIPIALSDSTRPSVRPEERVAYRIEEVVAATGVSRTNVRKRLGTDIRFRNVGGMVLLNPEDVHRTFGFMSEATVAPSREALADMEELLQ